MRRITKINLIIIFICFISLPCPCIAKDVECIAGIEAIYNEYTPSCPIDSPVVCCSCYVIPACACCPESHRFCTPENYCCDGDPCLAEIFYRDNKEVLTLLRLFRDDVLAKSPLGQELIRLYYRLSTIMLRATDGDQEFTAEVKGLIDSVLPMIEREVE